MSASKQSSSYGRGAAILSVGIGATGLITFAFFSIASHVLPEDEYGRITLLWSAVFIENASMTMRHMAFKLAWSSMTPFGRPVVPLV